LEASSLTWFVSHFISHHSSLRRGGISTNFTAFGREGIDSNTNWRPSSPKIGGAADEVRVVRVRVAETFFGTFVTRNGLDNLVVELAHAFLHGDFAQCGGALVVPGAQVEILALA
jgi:hypothetical protein